MDKDWEQYIDDVEKDVLVAEPEAGRHPSNPVLERSWDAFFN